VSEGCHVRTPGRERPGYTRARSRVNAAGVAATSAGVAAGAAIHGRA